MTPPEHASRACTTVDAAVVPGRRSRLATRDGPPPPALARAIGPLVPVLVGVACVAGLVLRQAAPAALPGVGVIVLIVAVVLGLPHGALDVSMLASRRQRTLLGRAAAYAIAACGVYGLWLRWPAAGVAVLLAVSAAHFALSDVAISGWRRPLDRMGGVGGTAVRGWATGVLSVAGPFAVWPAQTGAVLAQLHAGPGTHLIVLASQGLLALALAAGVWTSTVAVRNGDLTGAVEFWVLAALVASCPPLFAFGIYFAVWHSMRQTARLLLLDPLAARRLSQHGWWAAAGQLARAAAVPTVVAAAGLVLIGLHHNGVTATVLVGLLAVSVPHALVVGVAEHRLASQRGAGRAGLISETNPSRPRSESASRQRR